MFRMVSEKIRDAAADARGMQRTGRTLTDEGYAKYRNADIGFFGGRQDLSLTLTGTGTLTKSTPSSRSVFSSCSVLTPRMLRGSSAP